MDVGTALAAARQRAGLTRDEISRRTNIEPPAIEALEENAFWRLPEGAYLDGIVRTYAREVGLDPDEFVDHVHADTERRMSEADGMAPLDDFPSEADAPPAEPHPAAAPELDVFASEEERPVVTEVNASSGIADHAAPHQESGEQASTDFLRPAVTTYRPDFSRSSSHRWGFVVVALAGALLGAIGTAAYLSGRAPSPALSAERSAIEQASDEPGTAGVADGRTPSRPVDSTTGVTETAPGGGATDTAPEAAPAGRSSPPTPSRVPSPAAAPKPAAPRSPDPAVAASASTSSQAGPELAGVWTIATRVESSSVKTFEGLRLGYYVDLQQNGNTITGTGRKVSENGLTLRRASQTPIALRGTVDGDALVLSFSEGGRRRRSSGKFILTRAADDVLQGRFSSDAAQSTGTVEARRR
jgi:hypothetical protein